MSFSKKISRMKMNFMDWLYQRSIVSLTAFLGVFLTLFVTGVHCLIVFIVRNESLGIMDVLMPLGYGAILTPFLVFFFSQVFSEIEKNRMRVLDMQRHESRLKNSLAKTYIAMINQRDRNITLTQDHERLQGTLHNEIQERQAAQNRLDEQIVFFSAIVDLTPDIILYRNASGDIRGSNYNLLRLLGVSNVDELKEKLTKNDELRNNFTRGDDQVISTGKDFTSECKIDNYIFQIRKRPAINQRGQLIGTMIYGHDITKLKNEQDLLAKTSQEKSNFISTLSHELRTPLNGIVGLSDILMSTGHFIGEDMRNLKAINVSAVTLGNIFNDVIDLNKFERRTFNVIIEKVKWPDFLEDFETLSRLMTEQKNLSYSFKVDGLSPYIVETDPTRLRQMLWNVIANAIKFTHEGGVSIYIKQKIEHDKLLVSFAIKDTGIGIAPEEKQKIFNLYYQVPGTKQSTGTGIGLNVTKHFADALHGTINLESKLGKGSTFTISFAFKIINEYKNNLAVKTENLKSLHVLLVEDVDLNILVCRAMLEKLGNTVTPAKTGKEAIEAFNKGGIDLVLLDMQLPDMTGLDVADILVNKYNCSVPMIALTANVIQAPEVYKAHKIEGVLTKPLSASKLADTLKKYRERLNK